MSDEIPDPFGILLIDKPPGRTSHDVVARMRRSLGTRRVGHAGTLDPMATGLLVLGFGAATRLLTFLVGLDKEYEATIRLGASTTTDDAEGERTSVADPGALAGVDDARLRAGIAALTGAIEQVPSTVSAIKIAGRPAHRRVRDGETVTLQARSVTVSAFDLLAARTAPEALDLDVRVRCSSGTYVRALARDLGADLGVGGHLTALRRTEVGPFRLAEAMGPDEESPAARALSAAEVAGRVLPVVSLDGAQADDLWHGRRARVDAVDAERAAGIHDGRLVGILAVESGSARSLANFPRPGEGS